MISAEQFARGRTSYWGQLLPRLDRFVRAVNVEGGRFSPPIASEVEKGRHAFIAELAFELMRIHVAGAGPPDAVAFNDAIEVVRRRIGRLSDQANGLVDGPGETEMEEVFKLQESLLDFLRVRGPRKVTVGPKIPGCGIIDPAEADLLLEQDLDHLLRTDDSLVYRRLFEVKMVERNFRAADFRQLATYAALLGAAETAPDGVGLVNPRRGTFFECTLEELAWDTAGLGADELIQQIVFDISTAEVSL